MIGGIFMRKLCIVLTIIMALSLTACSGNSSNSSSESQNSSSSSVQSTSEESSQTESEGETLTFDYKGEEQSFPAKLQESGQGFTLLVADELDVVDEGDSLLISTEEDSDKNYLQISTMDGTLEEELTAAAEDMGLSSEDSTEVSLGTNSSIQAEFLSSEKDGTLIEKYLTEQDGKVFLIEICTVMQGDESEESLLLHAVLDSINFDISE